MNKVTKIIVILMVLVVIVYILIGLYNKLSKQNPNDNISDNTIVNNSGDKNNQTISYTIIRGENDISVVGTSSGDITRTNYIFENDKLVELNVLEEVETPEIAESIYEKITNDASLSQIYSDIKIDGNKIYLILKQEYVDAFAGMTLEEVYENQKAAIEQNTK